MSKYIYMWFDGDVKRHYFSSKAKLNAWIKEFTDELMSSPDFGEWVYCQLKDKPAKEVRAYFSKPMFVEKITLDI